MAGNRLVSLLGMALLVGCSYSDMACDRPDNIQAAEQGFAAHVSSFVTDTGRLKENVPGVQRVGSDAQLARLLEGFVLPELQLVGVREDVRRGFGARTCSGQVGVTVLGVEKDYPLRYEIGRSGLLAGVKIEFIDPSVATTTYSLIEEVIMAQRRANTLARYKQLSDEARDAGFDDLRIYERHQSLQARQAVLLAERQRIQRGIAETLKLLEESKARQLLMAEEISVAEKAYQELLLALKTGRHIGISAQAIHLQDIDLAFSGDEGEPQVSLVVQNTGSRTLSGADIEVSLFLNGNDEPFLVSGDRMRGGRFVLRFKEPALQPGETIKVMALSVGPAEDWREPEVMAATRRQLVVRVLDNLTMDGVNPEAEAATEPSVNLSMLQRRAEQAAQTTALLDSRLAELQAAYDRVEIELAEQGQGQATDT